MEVTRITRLGRLLAWISLSLGCLSLIAAPIGAFLQRHTLFVTFVLLIGVGSITLGGSRLLTLHQPRTSLIGSLICTVCYIAALIIFFLCIRSPQ
jgi:hypothetical protein